MWGYYRHIGLIPPQAPFDCRDGVCVRLRGDLCAIYEDRPEICRVDAMYERYFSEAYTKEEFYRLNLRVCQALQDNRRQADSH